MENGINYERSYVMLSTADLKDLISQAVDNRLRMMEQEVHNTNDGSQEDEYITRKEAASILQVDYTTMWRWAKSGFLVPKKMGGQRLVYSKKRIMELKKGD